MTQRFPGERIAAVTITLADGQTFSSGPTMACGDMLTPLSDAEIACKFHALAGDLPGRRRRTIEKIIGSLGAAEDALPALLDSVLTNAAENVPASKPAFADLA